VAKPVAASPIARAYVGTPPPSPATPWREADYCVIDLETTGLDPAHDEIISFATLNVIGGRLRLADARYELVRPRHMPDGETIRIHGLRSSDLAHAPTLSEALDGLLEALTGKVFVAHFAAIEKGFLAAALNDNGVRLRNPLIDTASLAAELFRRRGQARPDDLRLSSLARALSLPVHRPHHADGDALTTAQVFLALATHLDALEPHTVGSLQRYGSHASRWSALRRALTGLTRG
jgi:DNA polymerase-3 subunit epsilon